MTTDLGEILIDLVAAASTSSSQATSAAADARIALSRLRPALERLRDDGLDTGAPTTDPDAFARQAERVHWVRLLANTCARLGTSTGEPETPGPMTRLADAAAVAAVLHADVQTNGQRWAIVAGLAQAATHLVGAAGGGEHHSPDVDRALIIAEASSGVLFQFASLDPPSAADYVALHRPIPNPSPDASSASDVVLEASAGLVHATRPGTGPHSIADLLAIATAVTTACRFVENDYRGGGADRLATQAELAVGMWTDLREQLAPFNDGSRRPQAERPPAVDHALRLHRAVRALESATPSSASDLHPSDVSAAIAGRLAKVADHIVTAFADNVAHGRLMAHAVDLPLRESRVSAFLDGRRSSGLVTADADDVAPARAALVRARAATVALSVDAAGTSLRCPSATQPHMTVMRCDRFSSQRSPEPRTPHIREAPDQDVEPGKARRAYNEQECQTGVLHSLHDDGELGVSVRRGR